MLEWTDRRPMLADRGDFDIDTVDGNEIVLGLARSRRTPVPRDVGGLVHRSADPPQPIGEPAVEAERTLCWDNPAPARLRLECHGGHTRSTTRPTMESTGTGPNERESTEPKRWSPSMKTVPAGTLIGPK
jgi:hypothetical protein